MTTQAQIEAAETMKKALENIVWVCGGMITAETANECDRIARRALTAAAEVGEPVDKYYAMSIDRRNKIIERCAQWLKEKERSPYVHLLADEMCRALKDS